MSKKLTITEALKMPVGTEFEVHYDDGGKAATHMIMKENESNRKYLDWIDGDYLKVFEFLTNATFIPIEQPVTFIEAITSGKRIKVVHARFGRSNIYMSISDMFKRMSCSSHDDFIPTLINEGQWYIEESEEIINE